MVATHRETEKERQPPTGAGRKGVSKERKQESLVIYKSFNILCCIYAGGHGPGGWEGEVHLPSVGPGGGGAQGVRGQAGGIIHQFFFSLSFYKM